MTSKILSLTFLFVAIVMVQAIMLLVKDRYNYVNLRHITGQTVPRKQYVVFELKKRIANRL